VLLDLPAPMLGQAGHSPTTTSALRPVSCPAVVVRRCALTASSFTTYRRRVRSVRCGRAFPRPHLSERTMPTTTFALRPARRLAGRASAARYRLLTRRV